MNLLKNDKFDDPDLGDVTVPVEYVATTTVATTAYFANYPNSEFESEPGRENEQYSAYTGARPNVGDYSAEG